MATDASSYLPPTQGCASLLTPPGPGGIATIAVSTTNVAAILAKFFRGRRELSTAPDHEVLVGMWRHDSGQDEELIASRISSRGFEIHCHGGPAIVAAILSSLESCRIQVVPWSEWLRAEGSGPLVIEAHEALARAKTGRAASILLRQLNGQLQLSLVKISNDLAQDRIAAARTSLEQLDAYSELGLHLVTPWRVVLAGEPNVGKSSLINAIVGYQRSIVDPTPGTTRDVLVDTTALDGWPVEFADTAGLRTTSDPVENAGVERAQAAVREADLVVWVQDARNFKAAQLPPGAIAESRWISVLNKSDLVADIPSTNAVVTSAKQGTGIERLIHRIVAQLIPNVPQDDQPVPFTRRQVAGIRQALQFLERGYIPDAIAELRTLQFHAGELPEGRQR